MYAKWINIIVFSVLFLFGCGGGNTKDNTTGTSSSNISSNTTSSPPSIIVAAKDYPLHQNISVTYYWVGEPGDQSNGYIPNSQSVWDDNWLTHFGGVDDPKVRNGYEPANFVPLENPFYFALPYNDFDARGNRKASASDNVYWANEKQWGSLESMCKNRWIVITKNGKSAYAQWQDSGPFGEDDAQYVFGSVSPINTINNHAGLDVSPAVKDYLGLSDIDKVDWQFIDASSVPDGPWKTVITTSQISWN